MISMDPRATAQGPPSPDAASAKMMIRQDDGARGAAGARNGFAGVLSRQAAGAEGAEDIAATPGSGPLAPDPSGEADADTPTQVPETAPVPGEGARLPSGDGPDETPVAGPGPATPDAKTNRPVEQGNGMQPVAGGDTPRLTAGIFPRQGGQPGPDGPDLMLGTAEPPPASAARAALPPPVEAPAPPRRGALGRDLPGWTAAVPFPGQSPGPAPSAVQTAGPLAQALPPFGGPAEDAGRLPVAEGGAPGGDLTAGPVGERPAAGAPPVPATATAARATPAHVTQQIAVSVSVAQGGETEVRLNPEDLGRVRLALSGAEGTLTVTISAERPETADLLRRHIDSLAREFAALGYGDVGFHFEGESREDRAQDRPGGQGGSAPDPAPTEETDPKPPRRTLVIGGGLDLKL